jgi:MraZ protein
MIIGEYQNRIGEKKRVALPKKFRAELGNSLILTRGYENCLVLVNTKMWESIASEVVNGSFINSKIRDTSRFLVGSAVEVQLDPQGRFVIPQPLFDHAKFEDEIVFIGLVNWIEIWNKKEWEAKLEGLKANSSEIADQLINSTK